MKIKFNFNRPHYERVRRERTKVGLPVGSPKNGLIEDHPLKGKKIIPSHREEIGIIQNVYKHWYHGYYLMLLVNYNGSHGNVWWENINCENEIILDSIAESRRDFRLEV